MIHRNGLRGQLRDSALHPYQEHDVETESTWPQVKQPSLAAAGRNSAPGLRREPGGAMDDVRLAWKSVFGPEPLAPELTEQLLVISNPCDIAPGQLVLSHLSLARSLCLLVNGDVGLGVAVADAPFHPERSVRGPAWLDISSAWLGRAHALDAVAFSPVRVVNVSRGAYQTLMARHPDLSLRTVLALAGQVHALTEATHDLMHKDAEARLTAWLLQRCVADPAEPNQALVKLGERKRDIASQLAITPETLSRLLRQLVSDGLIAVQGYTIGVLDLNGLRARVQI